MSGIDGCVLIRSSNPAVLVPYLRTAVREGGNGDGCVLIRSALSIGRPIVVGITLAHSSRSPDWATRQPSKWSNWEIKQLSAPWRTETYQHSRRRAPDGTKSSAKTIGDAQMIAFGTKDHQPTSSSHQTAPNDNEKTADCGLAPMLVVYDKRNWVGRKDEPFTVAYKSQLPFSLLRPSSDCSPRTATRFTMRHGC